jgi:uncharacterized damage-inducible protein DinB
MDDALKDNYRFLARYNRWFNERLYDACEHLSDDERQRDRGAFFGSIHGTLNHLVWGDTMWLGRFAVQGEGLAVLMPDLLALPDGARFETVLHTDWLGLRQRRRRLDGAIEDWVGSLPADFFRRTMRYVNTKGVQREHPMWQAMTHFFNHQTHHRGQVTTLLNQAGVDVGMTDLIALV